MSLQIKLEPIAYRQLNEQWIPGLRPYPYQLKTFELVKDVLQKKETLCIFLVTPTGSGKTLASYAYSTLTGTPALGAYPTNELIRDQERALKIELEKTKKNEIRRVDSEELDKFEARYDYECHGDVLDPILNWREIILTNPDILYYLVFGLYEGLPGLTQRLYRLLVDNYRIFIFDEFHLYNVKQMGNALFFIGSLHRINPDKERIFVFASATPEVEFLRQVERLGINSQLIEEKPVPLEEGWLVAQELNLTIFPSNLEHWDMIKTVRENWNIIGDFIKRYPEGRIVSIVDSVAGSIELANEFRVTHPNLSVGEVHGLSSKEARESGLKAQVTVGTSTIEVGVDFKGEYEKDFLIFEARTSGQFIQRLGRIARHEKSKRIPNSALALVPHYVYHYLESKLNGKDSTSRKEFYDLIYDAYRDPEEFHGYIKKHSSVEMYKGSLLVTSLFMEDVYGKIRSSLGEVIEIITGNSLKQATSKYHDYEKRRISHPLFTFRGSEFQAALIDERGTDFGFPFKISDLMFLLRRGVIQEISEKEFFETLEKNLPEHSSWHFANAIVRKKAKLIQSGEKYLLGVFGFFKFQGVLNKPRKVWFEIPLSSLQQRKGEVTVISYLELCTDPDLRMTNLQKNIRKKQFIAWCIDKSPNFIRFGRSLPPLFEVFPLRVSLPGGRLADTLWSIGFNQNAFFLDSLRWKKEDTGGETLII